MRKNLLSLVILSTAFISCSDEKEEPIPQNQLSVECYSRSGETSQEQPVQDFGMYIISGESPHVSVTDPMHVTWNGSGWNYPSVVLTEKTLTIAAFCPFIANSMPSAIPMNLNPQTDYLASAEYTVSNQHPNVKFTMNHLLSCIKVSIDNSSDITVDAKDIPTSASYDLKTQTLSVEQTPGKVSGSSELYLFPASRSVTLDITYKGKKYAYQTEIIDFAPGKQYLMNLTVDNTKDLQIDGAVIEKPWEIGGKYDGTVKEPSAEVGATYEFAVTPASSAFDSAGGSALMAVTSKKYSDGSLVDSSVGYSATSMPSWCSFSNGTLTVTENSGEDRSGTVILKQNGSGKTVSISVKQKGRFNVDVE